MSMPTCEPGQRLLDEQDYVQAYENVREKYKGKDAPALLRTCAVLRGTLLELPVATSDTPTQRGSQRKQHVCSGQRRQVPHLRLGDVGQSGENTHVGADSLGKQDSLQTIFRTTGPHRPTRASQNLESSLFAAVPAEPGAALSTTSSVSLRGGT